MEGRCRRCGEKLSLLQRLQGQDFCSPEHKAEFQREQEELALARLQQTATTLRRMEVSKPPGKGIGKEGGLSELSLEAKRDSEPPLAAFVEHWRSAVPSVPLPCELTEEAFTPLPRFAGVRIPAVVPGLCGLTPLEEREALRGDMITILSPRANSIHNPGAPAIGAYASRHEDFPWEATALMLEQGPDPAGILPLQAPRSRVHEPVVRWPEPVDIDFDAAAVVIPPRAGATGEGLEPPLVVGLFDDAVSLFPVDSGLPAADGVEPDPSDAAALQPLAGSRAHRPMQIPSNAAAFSPRPMVAPGERSAGATLLGPAGLTRGVTATAAQQAAASALPHLAAVPVPVRPGGYDYAPDLTPVAIESRWIASPVPMAAHPVETRPRVLAKDSSAGGAFAAPPVCGNPDSRLDRDAANWATPAVAQLTAPAWSLSVDAVSLPTGEERCEPFPARPLFGHRSTWMRAVVPSMKRRIKMEVHFEPPRPTPWFEPMTCAFGGDVYGSH